MNFPLENDMTLLVRDNHWLFVYWDLNESTAAKLKQASAVLLRIDLLNDQNPDQVEHAYDITVPKDAKDWYVHVSEEDCSYAVSLLIIDADKTETLLLQSNPVHVPRSVMSNMVDHEWDADDYDKIYNLSGGNEDNTSSTP